MAPLAPNPMPLAPNPALPPTPACQVLPISQQTPIFVAPPMNNTGAGMSLPSLFANIDEVLLLAIGQHAFKPVHLFKLDTHIKDKSATSFLDVENGAIIHKE